VRPGQPAPRLDDPHPLGGYALGDVVRLSRGERLDPRVKRGRVHPDLRVVTVAQLQAK
jgi:hypothetical protein